MTARQFAALSGVQEATLSRLMTGRCGIALETAIAIEDATRKAVKVRDLARRGAEEVAT